MPSQIDDQLRSLIELGAPPISLSEVEALRTQVPQRHLHRRVFGRALVGVACVIAVVVAIVLLRSDGDHGSVSVQPNRMGSDVAFAECASARNPRFGQGDGLPPKGYTDRAYVEQTLRTSRKALKKQFPEITGLRIAPRNGQVWSRDSNGDVVVEQLHDYWIEARVASVENCPTSPFSWGGVPVEFFAPQPLPTAGADLTGTLTDGRPYSVHASKDRGLCVMIGDVNFGCDSSRTPRDEQPGRWWIAVENNGFPTPQSGVLLYGVLPADATTVELVYDDGRTSRSAANLDLHTRLWAASISPGDNPATLVYLRADGSEVSHAGMH